MMKRSGDGGGRDCAGETEQDLARLVVDALFGSPALSCVFVEGGGGLLVLEVDAEAELDAVRPWCGRRRLRASALPVPGTAAHHEAQKLMTVTLPLAIEVCALEGSWVPDDWCGLAGRPCSKIWTLPSPATKRVVVGLRLPPSDSDPPAAARRAS